jgi:hypothetical protein
MQIDEATEHQEYGISKSIRSVSKHEVAKVMEAMKQPWQPEKLPIADTC